MRSNSSFAPAALSAHDQTSYDILQQTDKK